MINKHLSKENLFDGNSNEIIKLIEINQKKYVKKIWNDAKRGSEAIQKQIFFEEIISGPVRIQTPKVIDSFIDDNKKFVAIMEYVEGFSGSELHKISSSQLANNLKYAFSMVISKYYEQSIFEPIESNILLDKIKNIRRKSKLNYLEARFDALEEIVFNTKKICIPKGNCHGDLTTSNIIATGGSTFYLIDFLPCFLETPLWDILKIKQDLLYGWTTRHLKGYALNNAKILNKFLIPQQLKKFEGENNITNLFDAINIARLVPYIKDPITEKWVVKCLDYCINKLEY